jgi:hypothetical protein
MIKYYHQKKKLVNWILDCHNNVRKSQNKDLLTLDDFYNYYSKQINLDINRETSEVKEAIIKKSFFTLNNLIILVIIILLLILLLKN